jgi:hypothetical protein
MDMTAEIWGRTLQSVDSIDVTIINPTRNDDAAKLVLGYIATLPYKNAEPAKARAWVENTLSTITGDGDVKETTIGGVKFQLFGPPAARNLEIGSVGEPTSEDTAAPAVAAAVPTVTSAPSLVAAVSTDTPVPIVDVPTVAPVADLATEAPSSAPLAVSQPVSTNPTGKDSQGNHIVDPAWLPCSEGQIKGSKNGKYHVPGGRYYARTYSDVMCFNSEQDAEAAQFVRAKNQ